MVIVVAVVVVVLQRTSFCLLFHCVTLCLSGEHCGSKFQSTIVPLWMKVCLASAKKSGLALEVCLAAGEKGGSVLIATSVILSYTSTKMMICLSIHLLIQRSVVKYFIFNFVYDI